MPKFVSQTELAEICGLHPSTPRGWVKQGCPVHKPSAGKGDPRVFETGAVVEWLQQRAAERGEAAAAPRASSPGLEQLRARRIEIEIEKLEFKAHRLKGAVVDVDVLRAEWARVSREIRREIRSVPGRVTPQVIGETDESRIRAVTLAEIDVSLKRLASGSLPADSAGHGVAAQ